MSLVVTSIIHHEKAAMGYSPMQVDNPADHSGSSSAPETPEPGEGSTTGAHTERGTPDDSGSKPRKDLTVSVERTPEGDDKDDHLCVCAPEQKIPRPPNSFILYRSHQHPKVASENPGLSNPQISQIIGENWRGEGPEVKEKWKNLANEESKRHNLRYPGYRYQPRRRSKALAAKSDEDVGRCPRCGGRYTATPRSSSSGQPPTPSKLKTEVPAEESPTVRLHEQQQSRLGEREVGSVGDSPKKRVPTRRSDEPKSESPEVKRRRLVDFPPSKQLLPSVSAAGAFYGGLQHGQLYPQASPASASFSPVAPRTGGSYATTPEYLPHWQPMPPPPRPLLPDPLGGPTHRHGAQRGEIDESLRLPPLQTAFATTTTSSAREGDARTGISPVTAGLGTLSTREGTGQNTQEQIMSIAFARKLAMLSKICPPLPKSLGGAAGRGAIIALEGPKLDLLAQVGRTVEMALQVSPHVDLKCWSNDHPGDIPIPGNEADTMKTSDLKDEGPTIFKSMSDWHEKSKEITHYVQGQQTSRASSDAGPSAKTSVALIKDGFSLTVSDAFACGTRPSPNYGPAQHWEWMASLWRDIVGPDLVVYVKPFVEDGIIQPGWTVDFERRMGSIVVRVGSNRSLHEAMERRIEFEVIEWMRDGWIPQGTPQG